MDDTVTISISQDEWAFIESEIVSGRYTNASEVLRAGLAALEYSQNGDTVSRPAMETDGLTLGLSDLSADNFQDSSPALRQQLEASANSGTSVRRIPEIMADVKVKLRANGSL
jgi:putative addiction module CopG family antidote